MSVKHFEYLKVQDSKVLVVEVRPVKCLLDTPSGPARTDKWMEYSHWEELYHLLTDIVQEYEEQRTTQQIKYDQPECKTGATIQIGYMFRNLPSCWCSLYFLVPRDSCTWMEEDYESGDLQDKGGRFEHLVACRELLVVSVILRDSPTLSTSEGVLTPNCSGSLQQASLNQKLMKALDSRIEYISPISDYFKTSAVPSSDSSSKNVPSSSRGGKRKLSLRVKVANSTSLNEEQESEEDSCHIVGEVTDDQYFNSFLDSYEDSDFTTLEPNSPAVWNEKDLCGSTSECTDNFGETDSLDSHVLWSSSALAVTRSMTDNFEQGIGSPVRLKYKCLDEGYHCFGTVVEESEGVSSDLEGTCEHKSLLDSSASGRLGNHPCIAERGYSCLENGFEPQTKRSMTPSPTCESTEKSQSQNALSNVEMFNMVQENIKSSKNCSVISSENKLQNSTTETSAQEVMSLEDNGIKELSENVDESEIEMKALDDALLYRDEEEGPCSSANTVIDDINIKSNLFLQTHEVYSYSESHQSECRSSHDFRVSGSSSQDPYVAITNYPQLEYIDIGPQTASCMTLNPSDDSGKQNSFENVTHNTNISDGVQKKNAGGIEDCNVRYLSHGMETQISFSPEGDTIKQLKLLKGANRMTELFGEVKPEIETDVQDGAACSADDKYVPERIVPKGKSKKHVPIRIKPKEKKCERKLQDITIKKKKCKNNLLNIEFEYAPSDLSYLSGTKDGLYLVEDSLMQDESVHNTQVSDNLPFSTEKRNCVPEGIQMKVQTTEGNDFFPICKEECSVENEMDVKDFFCEHTDLYITKAPQGCLSPKKLASQEGCSDVSLQVNRASCTTGQCSQRSLNYEGFLSSGSNEKSLQSTKSDYLETAPLQYSNSLKSTQPPMKTFGSKKYLKIITQRNLDGDQHENLKTSKAKCVNSCKIGGVKKKSKTYENLKGNLEISKPKDDKRMEEAEEVPCSSLITVTDENNDKSNFFLKAKEVDSHSESHQSECRSSHDLRVSGTSSQNPYVALRNNPQLENIMIGLQTATCMTLGPSDELGKQNSVENITHKTSDSDGVQKKNIGGIEDCSVGYLSHEMETQSSSSPKYDKIKQVKLLRGADRMAELFGKVDEPAMQTDVQDGAPCSADDEYVPERIVPKGRKKCKRNLLNTVPTKSTASDALSSAEDSAVQTNDSVHSMQVLEDLPLSARKRCHVPEREKLKVQAAEGSVVLSTWKEKHNVGSVLEKQLNSFPRFTKKCLPCRKLNTGKTLQECWSQNRLVCHVSGECHIRTDPSKSFQNCENVHTPELHENIQQSTVHDYQEAAQFTCHRKRVKERHPTESLICLRSFECKEGGNVDGSWTEGMDFEKRNRVFCSARKMMKGTIFTDFTEESEQSEREDRIGEPALENSFFDHMPLHNSCIFSSSDQEQLDSAEDIVQLASPANEQHHEKDLISSPTSASPKQSKTPNALHNACLHSKEKENLESSENEIASNNSSAMNYNQCVRLKRSWKVDRMIQFSKDPEDPKIQDASQSDRQDEKMVNLRRSSRLKDRNPKNFSELCDFYGSENEDLNERCSKGERHLSVETEKLMKFFQKYRKEKSADKGGFKQKKIIDYIRLHNTPKKRSDEEEFKSPNKKNSAAVEGRKKSGHTSNKQKDVRKRLTKKSSNKYAAVEMSSKPSSSKHELNEVPEVTRNYYNKIWDFTFPDEQMKKSGNSSKSILGKKKPTSQKQKSVSPKNSAKGKALRKKKMINTSAVGTSESELDEENCAPGTLNDDFFFAIQAEMEQFSAFLSASESVLGSSKSSHSILKVTEEFSTAKDKREQSVPAKKVNSNEEEPVIVATRTLDSLRDSYMRLQSMTESDLEQCMDENLPYLERVIRGAEPNERHEMFNASIPLLKRQPDYLICGPFTADQSEYVLDLLKKKLSHLDKLVGDTFDLLTYRCRVLLPTFLTKIVMDNENVGMKEAEELMAKFSISQNIAGSIDTNDWRKF